MAGISTGGIIVIVGIVVAIVWSFCALRLSAFNFAAAARSALVMAMHQL